MPKEFFIPRIIGKTGRNLFNATPGLIILPYFSSHLYLLFKFFAKIINFIEIEVRSVILISLFLVNNLEILATDLFVVNANSMKK